MFNIFGKSNSERVYLDYAGATPMSEQVLSAVKTVENLYANPSGIYNESVVIKKKIEECRKNVLGHFDAISQKVIFTQSATQSINVGVQGILEKGDHLIISAIEHPAVLGCAKVLEKENEIELTIIPVNEKGIVDTKVLRESIKDNTKLVSIMFANNEIGTIQPIKEIGRIIDEYKRSSNRENIYFHTDATQAVNYININMNSNRLDMISFNGSKIYAGKGSAALIYHKKITLKSIIFGGGQENNLWSGTEDVKSIVALTSALNEIKNNRDRESSRLAKLQSDFIKNIKKEIPETIVWGNIESRLPNNINIGLPGIESDEMVIRLNEVGFAVSHKSACSALETSSGSYVLQNMGASMKESSENIRISMGRATTERDMKNLIKAIKTIYYKYKK